jgi:hypothetical protein
LKIDRTLYLDILNYIPFQIAKNLKATKNLTLENLIS